MDLMKQVCTLEQAKKLKALGVEQNSAFYFYEQIVNGKKGMKLHPIEHHDGYGSTIEDESIMRALNGQVKNEVYSAYTVAELGVMLPSHSDDVGVYYTIQDIGCLVDDTSKGYDVKGFSVVDAYPESEDPRESPEPCQGVYYTEAEARAAILIWLLENNHTTPEEVNTRLSNQ